MIAREIDSGAPRIKMYYDDSGNFKGEALVVYFRPESVSLAIQMVDETDFREGNIQLAGKAPMRVQAAELSFKTQTEAPAKSAPRDRRKIMERTEELNRFVWPLIMCSWFNANIYCVHSLLTDWDDDDPLARNNIPVRQDRTVVLKGLFTLEELQVSLLWPLERCKSSETDHCDKDRCRGNPGYQR